MKIYTRKNALVGYLVLNARKRAVQKRVRRRRRSGLKVAAYVGLGLVSAGLLAAVFAVALKRRAGETGDIVFEGESEIVAGYFVEYSGMKWGMFMTGEYVELMTSSAILVTIFFVLTFLNQ